MFSEACVKNSVRKGAGVHGKGVCVAGGAYVAGVCMAGDTATAADGTHPTGMHSC